MKNHQHPVDEMEMKVVKFSRGKAANLAAMRDKKLKGQLTGKEKLIGISAKAAAQAEKWFLPVEGGYLEPEGLEKTYRFSQHQLRDGVDILNSRKPFDIILPELGPYTLEYTSNGRYMIVGGRKGHIGMMDMLSMDLIKEFQVRETVRDVAFLHNEQLFAVAQKKYPYIYNRHGTEIHCLKEHGKALKLQFLDKHFLLASINSFGQLHYQDMSTGEMVANHRTGLGRTDVMRVNPYNAVIGLGHAGGKVTMWKPTSVKPLVTMLCHNGPVTAVAFERGGHLMATAGVDKKIKIWDLRKYEVVRTHHARAESLDFSQKGLLAASNGSLVEREAAKEEEEDQKEVEEEIEDAVEAAKSTKVKNKTKGRSKPSKRAKKKEEEVLRAKRPLLDQYKEIGGNPEKKQRVGDKAELPKALQRFAKNKQS
ncbi:hypothetical protein ZWY2020_011634 [Hordeum vulgare]|nr:hypothetical protein ZWY2020_011634 [Hordeum vulgare]